MTSTPSTVAVGASNEAHLENGAAGGASLGGEQRQNEQQSFHESGTRESILWTELHFQVATSLTEVAYLALWVLELCVTLFIKSTPDCVCMVLVN